MSGKRRIQEKQSLEGTSEKMFRTPPQPLHQMARDNEGGGKNAGDTLPPRSPAPRPQAHWRLGEAFKGKSFHYAELQLDCEN